MITDRDLPQDALLARYRREDGHYSDCFTSDLNRDASLAEYVVAFYTAPLFRCERALLRLVGYPSTDAGAHALATETSDHFAVWTLEDRTETELLMCDMKGRTRSWLKVEPTAQGTRLSFGSAVVSGGGTQRGWVGALGPLHRLYSKLLLGGAVRKMAHSTFSA